MLETSVTARPKVQGSDYTSLSIAELMPHLLSNPDAVLGTISLPCLDEDRIDLIDDGYVRARDSATRPLINVINTHMPEFAKRVGIDLLAPPNSFFHWLADPADIEPIRRGEIRLSRNAITGQLEDGVSVAEGPWHYFRMRTHCIFVSGINLKRGGDQEPLLLRESVQVVGPLMTRDDVLKAFRFENEGTLTRLANERYLPPAELLCFTLGA